MVPLTWGLKLRGFLGLGRLLRLIMPFFSISYFSGESHTIHCAIADPDFEAAPAPAPAQHGLLDDSDEEEE